MIKLSCGYTTSHCINLYCPYAWVIPNKTIFKAPQVTPMYNQIGEREKNSILNATLGIFTFLILIKYSGSMIARFQSTVFPPTFPTSSLFKFIHNIMKSIIFVCWSVNISVMYYKFLKNRGKTSYFLNFPLLGYHMSWFSTWFPSKLLIMSLSPSSGPGCMINCSQPISTAIPYDRHNCSFSQHLQG